MGASLPRRKVLVIEDEPDIRNVLYVLLAGLGCDGDVAPDGRQALAMISRESFDTVLLDLRCSRISPEKVVSEIKAICPRLIGRVLVITGETTDPQTLAMLEDHCLPHVSRDGLLHGIWARIQELLSPFLPADAP